MDKDIVNIPIVGEVRGEKVIFYTYELTEKGRKACKKEDRKVEMKKQLTLDI